LGKKHVDQAIRKTRSRKRQRPHLMSTESDLYARIPVVEHKKKGSVQKSWGRGDITTGKTGPATFRKERTLFFGKSNHVFGTGGDSGKTLKKIREREPGRPDFYRMNALRGAFSSWGQTISCCEQDGRQSSDNATGTPQTPKALQRKSVDCGSRSLKGSGVKGGREPAAGRPRRKGGGLPTKFDRQRKKSTYQKFHWGFRRLGQMTQKATTGDDWTPGWDKREILKGCDQEGKMVNVDLGKDTSIVLQELHDVGRVGPPAVCRSSIKVCPAGKRL